MKLSKILVAVATVSIVSAASAETIPQGILSTFDTNKVNTSTEAIGVSAVAVITDCNTRNALQNMQGMSSCVGNNSKLCAPNISSAELRAMLTDSVNNTTLISNAVGGTLASSLASTAGTAGCAAPTINLTKPVIQFRHATGTKDAIQQFLNAGVAIGGFTAGAGPDTLTTEVAAGDAACITDVTFNGRVRFCTVHATSLSDSNNAGFVKLDGAAPDLVNLISSNYNLVSNLHHSSSTVPTTTVSAHGTTFGAYAATGDMSGDGVAFHNNNGTSFAAAPLSTHGSSPDFDSKGK